MLSADLLGGLLLSSLLGLLARLVLRLLILISFNLSELLGDGSLRLANFAVATEELLEGLSLLLLLLLELSVAHGVVGLLFHNGFRDLLLGVLFGNSLTFLVLSVVSDIVSNSLDVNTFFGLATPVAPAATSALFVTLGTTSARDVMIELSLATGYDIG